MALPTDIGYCTITGRFIRAILDGTDPDREPDGVPIPGLQISIKADVAKPSIRHAASKTTILLNPIDVTTNANGDLIGADLVEGIKVVAGDNPSLGIFTYTATIQGTTYPRQTLTFDAPTGGIRDLSDLVEVPPAPGATLNAWLDAKNVTLAARDQVMEALESGVGVIGHDGKSAYEIAVEQGFVGTEAAWVNSLKGVAGGITSVSVTQLTAGATPTVTVGGTSTARTLALGIPAGTPGAPGSPASNLVTSVAGRAGAVTLSKTDVGLSNVTNTADMDKPVSAAQAEAIAEAVPGEIPVGNITAFTDTTLGLISGRRMLAGVDGATGGVENLLWDEGTRTWDTPRSSARAFVCWSFWDATATQPTVVGGRAMWFPHPSVAATL